LRKPKILEESLGGFSTGNRSFHARGLALLAPMLARALWGRGNEMSAMQQPDPVLVYARLLRLTDRLLEVAAELRETRDKLQGIVERREKEAAERERETCK
jgi:hypothetical protein